jgi:hypothetical protein
MEPIPDQIANITECKETGQRSYPVGRTYTKNSSKNSCTDVGVPAPQQAAPVAEEEIQVAESFEKEELIRGFKSLLFWNPILDKLAAETELAVLKQAKKAVERKAKKEPVKGGYLVNAIRGIKARLSGETSNPAGGSDQHASCGEKFGLRCLSGSDRIVGQSEEYVHCFRNSSMVELGEWAYPDDYDPDGSWQVESIFVAEDDRIWVAGAAGIAYRAMLKDGCPAMAN